MGHKEDRWGEMRHFKQVILRFVNHVSFIPLFIYLPHLGETLFLCCCLFIYHERLYMQLRPHFNSNSSKLYMVDYHRMDICMLLCHFKGGFSGLTSIIIKNFVSYYIWKGNSRKLCILSYYHIDIQMSLWQFD